MTPAELDLARELVSRPWWEWRPGMRAVDARTGGDAIRICWVTDTGVGHGWDETDAGAYERHADMYWTEAGDVPDLRNPATQGWLAEMLLAAASYELTSALGCHRVSLVVRDEHYSGTSRGEALARALLAVRP